VRANPRTLTGAEKDGGEKNVQALSEELVVPRGHWAQYKMLFRNRSFMLMTMGFSLAYGFFNGLFTVLNQMTVPLGYTNSDVGLFGVLMVMCGVGGAGVTGAIVSKTYRYKETILGSAILAIGCELWFALSLVPDNRLVIACSCALLGFTALSLLPIVLEVSVEYTFPIPEPTSSGFLCAWGNLFALVYIGVLSFVDGQAWIGLGTFVVVVILGAFTAREYKRLNFENSTKARASS